MTNQRLIAINLLQSRKKVKVKPPSNKISDYFGQSIFSEKLMQQRLSTATFERLEEAKKNRKKIDLETANSVASAVKTWAIEQGVTHYTHWFQPLTESTAEKHDSFFDPNKKIEIFKGSTLIQQESDASSFPNGGIRSTFEARGYTVWDVSSPIFIYEETLCIPTIFITYTGEALDYKTPLLRSTEAINKASVKVCNLFDKKICNVDTYLGWEQEYFVIDKALYISRPDLIMSGKTVFGHNPSKGQQMDDHYFGSISSRVYDFMKDFEIESHKLGIPIMTRHKEVAPSQYEVAPMFTTVNLATDQNQLLMDVMEKIAEKHDLKVLFHEKPFANLNGSGKHNNWSLMTDTGINLFDPSESVKGSLMFLTFLICTIKAVHKHAKLLKASIASASNDYRLGTNEAPPAIISIFMGSTLFKVLENLEKSGSVDTEESKDLYMKLGIDQIPRILLDNTDRNRTSPFAFTGNKFEFRAIGSDMNVSSPMTVLNLIVADQLSEFYHTITTKSEKVGGDQKLAIAHVLREYIKSSKNVLFEGDGYSDDWVKEATKRGLDTTADCPRTLAFMKSEEAISINEKHQVLNKTEIEARYNIKINNYTKTVQIESRIMADIALSMIVPTTINYQTNLIKNARGLQDIGLDSTEIKKTIEKISGHVSEVKRLSFEMIEERKRINKIENDEKRALAYCDDVRKKYFDLIRYHVDKLEWMIDDNTWPLAKYREILFLK